MNNIFAFIALEEALDALATRRIRPEDRSRRDECVTAIRACMELIAMNPTNLDYTQKIRQALIELSAIARENGELSIAAQLKNVMRQLAHSEGYVRHQLARAAQAET
jgi:hypothetical protein